MAALLLWCGIVSLGGATAALWNAIPQSVRVALVLGAVAAVYVALAVLTVVRTRGIQMILPEAARKVLVDYSILDLLRRNDWIAKYLPECLSLVYLTLNDGERIEVIKRMPIEFRKTLMQKGAIHQLPQWTRDMIMPRKLQPKDIPMEILRNPELILDQGNAQSSNTETRSTGNIFVELYVRHSLKMCLAWILRLKSLFRKLTLLSTGAFAVSRIAKDFSALKRLSTAVSSVSVLVLAFTALLELGSLSKRSQGKHHNK